MEASYRAYHGAPPTMRKTDGSRPCAPLELRVVRVVYATARRHRQMYLAVPVWQAIYGCCRRQPHFLGSCEPGAGPLHDAAINVGMKTV